ncbi:hypothetical protein NET02_13940 [Thermomicrobiaceae bacterium CFH 74404]|uniref:Uncharacterized protein n=1 Tax=Thermalbibacter longus TaxID=2951981 RepID=A0AA41WGZ0_9BACT|nr:hypothetical protein [Thermalbibacter longus]MCM8750250.1 hypothetical protein [Thermalbibacter longus]
MADRDVIDALIATCRELNQRFRPKLLALNSGQDPKANPDSVVGILYRLRNRELNASQAVKEMLLSGETSITDDEAEPMVTLQQTALGLTPAVLLSQFGTAREATLAMVRDLPDEVWQQAFNTPRGHMTLREYLQSLVERDRTTIEQLEQHLAQASPSQ